MLKQQFDFCTPEEAQEAIERNKKLAEAGFDIREAESDEPQPKVSAENSITLDDWIGAPQQEFRSLDDPNHSSDWESGYWRMFDIVKDLIEEIKFLKGINESKIDK